MESAERDRALPGLAGGNAVVGRLNAVVRGVADQMDHRVAQFVDHSFIELRVFAADGQMDVFPIVAFKVSDHAVEPTKQGPDRQHPQVHDAFLNAIAHAVEQTHRLENVADTFAHMGKALFGQCFFQCRANLCHAGLFYRQLTGKIHQLVEPFDIHSHGFGGLD